MDDPGHNTAPISTRTSPLPINQYSWDVESDFVFRGIPRPLQPEWIDVGEEFGALPSESELSGGKSTLYNILRQKPAFHPPFYDQLVNLIPSSPKDIRNSKVLNRTKAISNWTITDPTIPRLETLVYAKNMFEDLAVAGRSRLEEDKVLIRYDKPRIWASLALLVPWYARRGLPTIIHCEKDVWEHFFHVIMLPAFHAHLATIAGTLDDEDLYLRFPFITSGRQGDHVIPDAVLATSKQEFKLGEVTGLKGLSFPLAVEVKCENVLTQTFRKTDENIFQDLRNPDGYAMKYRWPSTTLQKDNDTQSRVLCQVWLNLCKYEECPFLIFTSYHTTVFFIKIGNCLFMSPTYTTADEIRVLTYLFMSKALGAFPDVQFDLPDVNTKWWGDLNLEKAESDSDWSGIYEKTKMTVV